MNSYLSKVRKLSYLRAAIMIVVAFVTAYLSINNEYYTYQENFDVFIVCMLLFLNIGEGTYFSKTKQYKEKKEVKAS